jgi:hypothetical protein
MKKILGTLFFAFLVWAVYQWRVGQERDFRLSIAEKNMEQGERQIASSALRQLLAEQADDPRALRLLARMEASENPRLALDALHRLKGIDQATWQDLAFMVEISQDTVEIPVEKAVLATLQQDRPEEPSVLALLARQDFLEGRFDLALQRLAEFTAIQPDNRPIRLARARILFLSPDLVDRIQAKQTLFELGRENDWIGVKALRLIVNREIGPTLFREDLLKASLALQRHPLAGDAIFLRASFLRLQLEPAQRKEILNSAIDRLENGNKPLLAAWLNTALAPNLVIDLISLSEAVVDEAKFKPLFQAFLLLKKISEARDLLKQADNILDHGAKLRSAAYLELAEGGGSEALARFVRNAANVGDQPLLVEAGRLALLSGNGEESWNAYLQALETGGESIDQSVGLQLLQLALYQRKTKIAWRTSKMLAERFTRRVGNRNNFAYLSLLLNREVEAANRIAEESLRIGPLNTAFLSTLALGRLRMGRWEEARELMERRGDLGLTPGERATKAAIFLALGRHADAISAAQGLRHDMMLPEEWALLEPMAAKLRPKP